jgi:hypothetical protein
MQSKQFQMLTFVIQTLGPNIADMRWMKIIEICASVTSILPNLSVPERDELILQCDFGIWVFYHTQMLQKVSLHYSINRRCKGMQSTRNSYVENEIANLPCFQKSAFYSGIRIFNTLSCCLTNLKNEKAQFKVALRRYLHAHSFYSVDEFFTCTDDP